MDKVEQTKIANASIVGILTFGISSLKYDTLYTAGAGVLVGMIYYKNIDKIGYIYTGEEKTKWQAFLDDYNETEEERAARLKEKAIKDWSSNPANYANIVNSNPLDPLHFYS